MEMTEWRRVRQDRTCGACAAPIPKGAVARFITIAAVHRELVRCARCVGEAPPDLPVLTDPIAESPRDTLQPLKRTALGFTRARLSDQIWTARILGEKE